MAKRGQHNHDDRDQDVSRGHNNPSKSQTIVTGSYKKPETYKKQAALHQDPGKQAQAAKNDWLELEETGNDITFEADSEARAIAESRRSGSDSNADKGSRGY